MFWNPDPLNAARTRDDREPATPARRARTATLFILLTSIAFGVIADSNFTLRKQLTVKGGIGFIGNASMTCSGADPNCAAVQAGASTNQNFQYPGMDWVNVDGGTINSSTASLTLPPGSTVRNAYLYWGAWSDGTVTTAGSTNRGQVRLKVPSGSYQTVTAERTYTSLVVQSSQPCDNNPATVPADAATAFTSGLTPDDLRPALHGAGSANKGFTLYQSVAEVTSLLPSTVNGDYSVADIVGLIGPNAASAGDKASAANFDRDNLGDNLGVASGNCLAGWTMVVLYEDPSKTEFRSLNLFDGLVGIASNRGGNSTTVTGFTTPSGSFNGQVGMVAYDGDKGAGNDTFSITPSGGSVTATTPISNSASSSTAPGADFFNSTNTREQLGSPFTVTVIDGVRDGAATAAIANGADFRNPAHANQLGFDIDSLVEDQTVFGNGTTSMSLKFDSSGEFYLAGLFFLDVPTDTAELQLTKNASPTTVALGETVTFTMVVTNSGTSSATNVKMRDPQDLQDTLTVLDNPHEVLPAGFKISSLTTTQGTCEIKNATGTVLHSAAASRTGITSNNENAMIDCALGTMTAGSSVTVTLKGTVDRTFLLGGKSSEYTNIASVFQDQGNPLEASGNTKAITGEDVLLAGRVWNDDDHDRVLDDNETLRSGWTVNLRDPVTN
ncbi:MAG: DUF11 domain-containing protein, partial [Chromatiaceae bacterium]|nr:DUF11 domain-containing protein [Chromatiaceae bacterium]